MKKKKQGEDEDIVDAAFRKKWPYAFIVPGILFLAVLIFSNKIIDLNPSCTSAYVVSMEQINTPPPETYKDKYTLPQLKYRIKYQYYIGDKTYSFTKTFNQKDLNKTVGSGNSYDFFRGPQLNSLPIKYFKNFPWYHAVTNDCEE